MTEAAAAEGQPAETGFRTGSIPRRLLSDERLARRAARGDQGSLEAIYCRYGEDLYRFCLAMAGNPQDAQDALQNTMVKMLRALPGERRHIELKPWLYRIARNETVEILRKRRDNVELDVELVATTDGVVDAAETRERLRGLFADLEQLPERQRAAVVMREMGGLSFEQIGKSFDTSAAVVRQTVYEARLGLRQMEEGREMSCEAVTRALSDADGRVARRRSLRAHLRECESCRTFRDGIEKRRGEFAAIAPLPLALSAGLLQGALGVGKASAAAGVGGVTLAKSAATVAVVAAIGVTAADRDGLVDVPVLGGEDASEQRAAPRSGSAAKGATPPPNAESATRATVGDPAAAQSAGGRVGDAKPEASSRGGVSDADRAAVESSPAVVAPQAETGHGKHEGRPEGLPQASRQGQETAAARKPPQAATPPGPGGSGGGGAAGGNPPEAPGPPASAGPPAGKGVGPPSSVPAAPHAPGPPDANGQPGSDAAG